MPQPADDPVLTTFAAGTLLLSMATGLYLIYAQFHGPILRYVARRPVPWGAFGATIAALYLLNAFAAALPQRAEERRQDKIAAASAKDKDMEIDSSAVTEQLFVGMVSQVVVVAGFVLVIGMATSATPRDLGLPTGIYEFAIDLRTGFVAALAALAPVHLIQILLMYAMGMQDLESGHPLVKMVREGQPSVIVMVLASASAVIVAPICEEAAFRLLLQGWLEKWEDRKLGWRAESLPVANAGDESSTPETIQLQLANDGTRLFNVEAVDEISSSLVTEPPSVPSPPTDPPARGIAGFPYGWLPILISSLMFGIAHLGYGPEPVPLFFLALFLGYLYQRTHRIVPCIVCHALFNGFTVFVLWRMVFHGAH